MSLFSAIDVSQMTDLGLEELAHICSEMVKQLEDDHPHPHRTDYEELRGRLEGELRSRAEILKQRTKAATILQSAIRGKLARDEAERLREEARVLEQKTKAALAIQALFRGNQARSNFADMKAKAAEALKQEQERQTQAQLIKADQKLTVEKVDLARVKQDEKLALAKLIDAYDRAKVAAPNRKAPRAKQQALTKAENELNGYVDLLIAAIESQIVAEKKRADAARSVVLPPEFRPNGAFRDCTTVLYPAAGRLRIGGDKNGVGGKSYEFHPNRAMIHVKDELADDATLATAQAYFDSCLAACKTAIRRGTGEYTINARSPAGEEVRWNIKYKTTSGEFAGEIYHIDSGYAWSRWLPTAKRGYCGTCQKPKNRHDNGHPITDPAQTGRGRGRV